MKTAFPSSTLNILATLALLGGAAAAQAQGADGYPSKPVTLVVPTAPAGGTDTIARMFADVFSKAMKQPFIVENRPGANGILGVDYAAKGPADGSRVLFTYTASMVINPFLYKKLPYDPVKDFTPGAQVGRAGNLLLWWRRPKSVGWCARTCRSATSRNSWLTSRPTRTSSTTAPGATARAAT